MYRYEEQRASVFTEEGLAKVLKVNATITKALKLAGAVRMQEAVADIYGDDWQQMAVVDYLVETGQLVEIPTDRSKIPGQYRVFMAGRNFVG